MDLRFMPHNSHLEGAARFMQRDQQQWNKWRISLKSSNNI
jgi:hypothetical protein